MTEENEGPLIFSHVAAQGKPIHMQAETVGCPFCEYQQTENILQQEGNFLWIKNKFPTLNHTDQTLIIESKDHNGNISNYQQQENRDLIRFALSCWQQMKADPRYRSVLFYKNHGPLSGSSLKHPHMQIVGLEEIDGERGIQSKNFVGMTVLEAAGLTINFSKFPTMGFQRLIY